MRGSLSRCTTLSRRRARRPDSRIRRYNFLPAEGPVPVSALVIGNTDTFSSGAPPYSGGGGYPCASSASPISPAPSQGYSYASAGTPAPPAPSPAGYPYTSAGDPHLARALAWIPIYLAGIPTPPAPSALLPRSRRGGGVRAWRYLVGSRIRLFSRFSPRCGPCGYRHGGRGRRGGGTCSPSPVSHAPDTLLLTSPIPPGLQPAGYPYASAGTPAPPAPSPAGYPCTSAGSPHLARAFTGIPVHFCRQPPPHPRLRRSSPAPAAGAGSVRGDIR